jgi:hypothetical protein
MGKFNLTEAAKDILHGNVAGKQSGQDKPSKLHGDVAYGTHEAGDIGTKVTKTNDPAPHPTKGSPTATPPGATPPVGSEPMKHLDADKNMQSHGRKDLVSSEEGDEHDETSYDAIRDRKPATLAKQTMQANKGATFQSYDHQHEETESDEEALAEWKEEKETAAHERREMMKHKMKEKMKEDMDALLGGESLSEEFVSKATTIFEAAVIARAEMVIEEAENELLEQFEEAVESIKEDLAAKVDDYLNYMVEEWINENQIAIETGLRAEIVEDFITGLKGLFEEHYIDIPEEKVDVVEGLTSKVEELEAALNEQINRAVEMNKELNEAKKIEAIYTACEGLTQTQVEKMKSLAEGVEFTTEEEFTAKLDTLKESYFKSEVKAADSSALDDEVQLEEETKKPAGNGDALIEQYAKTISQTLK